jgi:dUTP pyrophosphatase
MPPVVVRIHRLNDHALVPAHQTGGSAGFDLASAIDVTIAPQQIVLVPTGLVIEVPPGHFLGIFARSSTPLIRGLMIPNGVGVVDSDYCGPADEIKIQVLNFTSEPVRVEKGDRLAQGILIPYVRVEWREDAAPAAAASRGGFGSTG